MLHPYTTAAGAGEGRKIFRPSPATGQGWGGGIALFLPHPRPSLTAA